MTPTETGREETDTLEGSDSVDDEIDTLDGLGKVVDEIDTLDGFGSVGEMLGSREDEYAAKNLCCCRFTFFRPPHSSLALSLQGMAQKAFSPNVGFDTIVFPHVPITS